MAAPGDKINPLDHILSEMSKPPAADEMPAEMLCPSGHPTARYIIKVDLSMTTRTTGVTEPLGNLEIPVWVCPFCVVAYRYQECRLIPGQEGHA
jgi:hypothetical protein